MRKLFKFLLWLVAIVFVLLIVVYLTAEIWLKTAVSTFIPQMTKTSASLQSADISLLSGKIALKGLKIGNPEGFKNPNAFELGEISVKFEPKSLLTPKIVINEIKIDGTQVDVELASSGTVNLMVLNKNVQEYLGNSVPANVNKGKMDSQKTKKKSEKSVVVKDLTIKNSSVDLSVMAKTQKLPLPDIHQKNIGEKTKETLPELVADVFNMLSASSIKEMANVGRESVNQLLDNLAGRSKEASGFVKGLKAEMKNLF